MDGFFVAKFKVEKRKKLSQAAEALIGGPQMIINEEGEMVEEDKGKSAFDNEADADLIKG